jgi:2-furoyl-CoA dehydrogenase FAD binding subunit
VKPAAFDYVRADSLEETLATLAEAGDEARVLAGGQSLLPMLNMRLAQPAVLVDVMRLSELQTLEAHDGWVTIGAAVRQAALQRWPDLARHLPLLAAVLPWVGHAQTRSRGTVCGSIAHADPSAELPLALVALGGEVALRSRDGERSVAAEDFLTGIMTTTMADDEMVTAVRLPAAKPGTGYAFREVARRHGDFAIVACATVVDEGGARLAVGGVADRPTARDLPPADDPALDDALNDFAWDLEARDDLHATARYRRELVRQLGRQVIEEAAACRG